MPPRAPNGADTDAFATPLPDSPTGAASRANADQQPTTEQLVELAARRQRESQTRAAAQQARQADAQGGGDDGEGFVEAVGEVGDAQTAQAWAEQQDQLRAAQARIELQARARAAQAQNQDHGRSHGRGHGLAQAQRRSVTDCAAFYPVLVYKAISGLNMAHGLAAVCMFVIWWMVTTGAAALPHWLLAFLTAWLIANTMFRFLFRAINGEA